MNEISPNYSPWVKKLLVLRLFNPGSGSSWMDHNLLIHRERKGHIVGSLEREVITEMRTKWLEQALPYLENPNVSDRDRAALQKDLEAVKWAGVCLDRLVEHEASEGWRSDVEPEPLESDPASGDNDEAKRGVTLEPAGNEKDPELLFDTVKGKTQLASVEFEVEEQSSKPSPAPPAAPLSRAQDSEAPPEPSTERDLDSNLFVQNPAGNMRVASFREGAIWLVGQCQSAYERLETTTDLQEAADIIHAQRLANQWADEIKADQLVRDHLSAILVRSLRRLGQIRAELRNNGSLKRGRGGKQLYFGLNKHTLRESDKLAQIKEDDDFEKRLNQKLKTGELTKYSSLDDPPAPKTLSKFSLFFRALKQISGDDWDSFAEGKYAKENEHEWAEITMGGRREKLRIALKKAIELLGPED